MIPEMTAKKLPDKFGNRWDAIVYVNEISLADMLVDAGYAVRKEYVAP